MIANQEISYLLLSVSSILLFPPIVTAWFPVWSKMEAGPDDVAKDSALVMAEFCGRRCHQGRLVVRKDYCTIPDCFPCDCSIHCSKKGTCCPTVTNTLVDETGSYQPTDQNEIEGYFNDIHSRIECKTTVAKSMGKILMVATCPGSWIQDEDDLDIKGNCENATQDSLRSITPYFEQVTGMTFANIFCAHCNGFVPLQQVLYGDKWFTDERTDSATKPFPGGGNEIDTVTSSRGNSGMGKENQLYSTTLPSSQDHTEPNTGNDNDISQPDQTPRTGNATHDNSGTDVSKGFTTARGNTNTVTGTPSSIGEYISTPDIYSKSPISHEIVMESTTVQDLNPDLTTQSFVKKSGITTENKDGSPQLTTESPVNDTDLGQGFTSTTISGMDTKSASDANVDIGVTSTTEYLATTNLQTITPETGTAYGSRGNNTGIPEVATPTSPDDLPTTQSTPGVSTGSTVTISSSPDTNMNLNVNHSQSTNASLAREASNYNSSNTTGNPEGAAGNKENESRLPVGGLPLNLQSLAIGDLQVPIGRRPIQYKTPHHDVVLQQISLKIVCQQYAGLYHIEDAFQFFVQAKETDGCFYEFEPVPSINSQSLAKCPETFEEPTSATPKCHAKSKSQYKDACYDLPQILGVKVSRHQNIFCAMCAKRNPSVVFNEKCTSSPSAKAKPLSPLAFDLTFNHQLIQLYKHECMHSGCQQHCTAGKILPADDSPFCLSAIIGVRGLRYAFSVTLVSMTTNIKAQMYYQIANTIMMSLGTSNWTYAFQFNRCGSENDGERIEIDISGKIIASQEMTRDLFEVEIVQKLTNRILDVSTPGEKSASIQFKPACLGYELCEIYRLETRGVKHCTLEREMSHEDTMDKEFTFLDVAPDLFCPHKSYNLTGGIDLVNGTLQFTIAGEGGSPRIISWDEGLSISNGQLKICNSASAKWMQTTRRVDRYHLLVKGEFPYFDSGIDVDYNMTDRNFPHYDDSSQPPRIGGFPGSGGIGNDGFPGSGGTGNGAFPASGGNSNGGFPASDGNSNGGFPASDGNSNGGSPASDGNSNGDTQNLGAIANRHSNRSGDHAVRNNLETNRSSYEVGSTNPNITTSLMEAQAQNQSDQNGLNKSNKPQSDSILYYLSIALTNPIMLFAMQ